MPLSGGSDDYIVNSLGHVGLSLIGARVQKLTVSLPSTFRFLSHLPAHSWVTVYTGCRWVKVSAPQCAAVVVVIAAQRFESKVEQLFLFPARGRRRFYWSRQGWGSGELATTVLALRSFLGFASYYRCFVEGAKLAAVLHRLGAELVASRRTERQVLAKWTDEHQRSVEGLKHKLTTTPVLAFTDFSFPGCRPSRSKDD